MTNLAVEPIHLARGGRALIEPAMTGPEWYESYVQRHAGDGVDGRLVALHRFAESWTSSEMHPDGDEVVLCIEGQMTLLQQLADGGERQIDLGPGDYAINPPGAWHTADCDGDVLALFITVASGTDHKPR